MTDIRFDLFRYQILPISQAQLSLFEKPISREELVERKNEIFRNALLGIEYFEHTRGELAHEFIEPEGDPNIIMLRLGVNRTIKRETRDFEEEVLDNWPNALIVFDNAPNVQKIAVEREPSAFQLTTTVIGILERSINLALQSSNLSFHVNPIFSKNEFWEIVENHPTTITEAEFRMISPNMSNISKSLAIDLKAWNRATNTQETTIVLESDSNSHLTLRRGDELVESLVDYASEGGGNIQLNIRGFKKVSTEEQITEISFNEMNLRANSPEEAREVMKMFKAALE